MIALDPVDPGTPVTVVMTVRDEEPHVAAAVASVLNNGHDSAVELVIAVAPSRDRTRAIVDDIASRDARVRVIDNPHGGTPQGLNLAFGEARTDVVVRMDGHGEMPRGYVTRAVHTLAQTGAANVGGRMVPQAEEPWPRAVAVAMRSKWGVGGAGHRVGGRSGPADSVFLGVFRAAAVKDVGGFDEHFARAQDWELNLRLRQAGYQVWFDPELQVAYRPRASWRALARQFFRSGQWRREVGRVHGLGVSVRYLAPPTVVVAIPVAVALACVAWVAGFPWFWLGFLVPVAYLAGVLGASMTLVRRSGWRAALLMPLVIMTMHLAWGAGFLRGVR